MTPTPSSRRPAARIRSRRPLRPSAKKSLGQHFLIDSTIVSRIGDALGPVGERTVVEIGAGTGVLTHQLASRARRVIAVELDDNLAAHLQEQFSGTNVEVIHGDALELEPGDLVKNGEPYIVAGNLPYNIAQPILRHVLEAAHPPQRLVVMVQAEVAKSIVAETGGMSLLSIAVQLYGEPQLLFQVPPSAFQPPPKVQSAVIRIDVAPDLRANVQDKEAFFRIVRAGFSSRRKQIRNALANGLRIDAATSTALLSAASIDPTLRPQALSLDAWALLERAWTKSGRPEGPP